MGGLTLRELVEHELLGLQLLGFADVRLVCEGFGEAHRELEYGVGGARERIALDKRM